MPPEPDRDRSVGEMLFDVSERVTILVREEFALAKAELTEKLTTLGRGAGVGIAAGVFLLAALIMLLFAFAYLINDLLGIDGAVWVGFAIEALIWIIVAAIAGLVAKRLLGEVETPTPDMAIEELKETKETLGKTP
jgi:Putative Actinobacterial Holin-X, holin superfamily III